jgi:DNA polymerase I
VNARIQGTASDIMKIALNRIFRKIKDYDAKMLLTVHDEVILEVNDNQLEEVKLIVKQEMETIG